MEAYVEYLLDELSAEDALERARRELPLGEYVRYDIEAIAEDWWIEMTVVEKPDGSVMVFDTRL